MLSTDAIAFLKLQKGYLWVEAATVIVVAIAPGIFSFIIVGMGSTRSIFYFFVEFMPKKVYHVENSYSKDVLKAF